MGYDKQQATEEFNRWSRSYDQSILQWLLFGPSRRALIRRIRQRFGDRPITVLDVGCGTGQFGEQILRSLPNARVVGMDLVRAMLNGGSHRWARHREGLLPVQGDSEHLPFASGSFDVVTCANSFHHYPDQGRAVSEMNRVLKPGGRLMLIDGYRDAPWGWFIYDVCVETVEGDVHHCSRSRMRDLFAAAGFVETEQSVHRGPAPFLFTEGVCRPASTLRRPHFPVTATGSPSAVAAD
ncbi:class I SAM-dependent methyltransferase [Tautonia sociabilis]|uniref:Methyltransferase domain-containing protein n=1 Tax=Tautonia sociabilis TaxID=2080755 RepID=A0A432ME10_9BACT|nr:class I SAM-dependent methyltransferase [Tautonia sociabilis]RUL83382.1 methyltransferase domain-containing protein [Tautonia sociabilis]